jgi:hypothetical protein
MGSPKVAPNLENWNAKCSTNPWTTFINQKGSLPKTFTNFQKNLKFKTRTQKVT